MYPREKIAPETPKLPITADERIWISEILNSYNQNICPDDSQLLRKCSGRISASFEPYRLDDRLRNFQTELNIYGIYCLDTSNEYISHVDSIIKHIQKYLRIPDNAQNHCSFSSEELSKALNIPPTQVKVSLKLISHASHYYDGGGGKINEFGYSSIEIKSFQTTKNYLNYDSIDRILEYFYNHYGQDDIYQKNAKSSLEAIPSGLIYSAESFSLEKIGRDIFGIPGDYKTVVARTKRRISQYPQYLLKKDSLVKIGKYYIERGTIEKIASEEKLSTDFLKQIFPQ